MKISLIFVLHTTKGEIGFFESVEASRIRGIQKTFSLNRALTIGLRSTFMFTYTNRKLKVLMLSSVVT